MSYNQAVKTAQEKLMMSKEDGPFTGGFDIMERLVKKMRKNPTPVKTEKDSMQPLDYAPDEPFAR
jgi:hypothetical protein